MQNKIIIEYYDGYCDCEQISSKTVEANTLEEFKNILYNDLITCEFDVEDMLYATVEGKNDQVIADYISRKFPNVHTIIKKG